VIAWVYLVFLGVCPKSWIYFQDSCYKISSKTLTYNAAKVACEALGSKLVEVNSQAENKAIASRVPSDAWVGLHRDPKNKLQWLTVDGSRVTYTHWGKGQPQNNRQVLEECAYTQPNNGLWHDAPCTPNKYYFVCKTIGEYIFIAIELVCC